MAANASRAGTREPISRAPPEAEPSAAMKASEVLAKAAELIEPEGAWYQGYFAATAAGVQCEPRDDYAACWCIYGAIHRVDPADDIDITIQAFDALTSAVGRHPPFFNDDPKTTQPDVVAALREAPELARSEGQ